MSKHGKLAEGALGTAESVVMGVAGTAPAFSVAATTATLVAAVGILSAASILYCGLIMFGVTLAFMHLNKTEPNAGASYSWVSREFNPTLGFFAGWALLVASAVFMVSGTIPAATATLLLVAPQLAADPSWVTAVAAGWLLAVSAVIVKGIKPTSYTQIVMTGIEVGVLVIVIIAAFVQFARHPAHVIGFAQFLPNAFTPALFATGALTALFFFWGWDVTVNLNEETRDASHAAGRAALWSMIIVMLLFITFVIAVLLVLSDEEIKQSGTNIVFALADKLFPRPWGYMAVIAVMLSSIGTLETSILQFTRTLFAQGRDGSLHPRYAKLHPTWRTPWVATLTIAVLGLVFLLLSSHFPSVNTIIQDSVNAIGFQVAFYYSLAGLACAWHYRKRALESAGNLLLLLLWPLLSVAVLIFIAIYSVPTFDTTTKIVGLGGIVIGVVPLLLNRLRVRQALRNTAMRGA
jgi:amino acid transporter